jgi:hypothetical protein
MDFTVKARYWVFIRGMTNASFLLTLEGIYILRAASDSCALLHVGGSLPVILRRAWRTTFGREADHAKTN